MTQHAAQPSTALPPVHSAMVIAPHYMRIRFSELFAALKQIAPAAEVGTWSKVLPAPPADDSGAEMIAVDGHLLAVFVHDRPAPAMAFEVGMLANPFMRDPAAACRGHRCHVNILRIEEPRSRAEAVALSRAMTLTAAAVARLLHAIAVKWTDADHIVPPSIVEQALPQLVPPQGTAPTLWVRLLVYRGERHSTSAAGWKGLFLRRAPQQPGDTATLVVGTVGLHAFGLRDLEYAPVLVPNPRAVDRGAGEKPLIGLPDGMLAHPLATSNYLLNSDAVFKDGETLGTPEVGGFSIAFKQRGHFLDRPVCLLTPIEPLPAGAGAPAKGSLKYDDRIPPVEGTRPLHSPSASNAALQVVLNEYMAGWGQNYVKLLKTYGDPPAREMAVFHARTVWDEIFKQMDQDAPRACPAGPSVSER